MNIGQRIYFWDGLVFNALGVPYILHTHSIFAEGHVLGYSNLCSLQGTLCQPSDAIIALSRVDGLYWSAYNERVFVVPNPIEKEINASPATNLESVAHFATNAERLVWAGRVTDINNYEHLIDIIDLVRKQHPNVLLTFCGTPNGASEESSFIRFRKEILSRRLDEHFNFVGYQKDIKPFVMHSKALLHLAKIGVWGMVNIEAMQVAVPTVCYELPYNELMRSKKGILNARFEDKQDLADKVIQILSDKELSSNLSNETKEVIEALNAVDFCRLWQGVFDSLLGIKSTEENSGLALDGKPYDFWGKDYKTIAKHDPSNRLTELAMIETKNLYF
jgi:glycosyltransferase involved in cell wall biosynthesis